MALDFVSATTNKVAAPNPQTTGSGTAFSYFQWIRRSGALTNGQGTSKGAFAIDLFVYFSDLFIEIPRATTLAAAHCDAALFELNEWNFWAATYDETDGPRLFKGNLASQVAEVSYVSRAVGAGATTADSGDVYINNRTSTSANAMPCRIATFAWFNRRLTLPELIVQQFAPMPEPGCTFFSHLGLTGVSAIDWSGNARTGVITGATLAAPPDMHRPLENDRRIAARQAVLI